MADAPPPLTPDASVEHIVARAAAVRSLPTQDHQELYVSLIEDLRAELDAEPEDEE